MNLSPKVWGPHAWFFLDSIVISIDNENIADYKAFFEHIQKVLPCAGCRTHYGEYLEQNPLTNIKTKDEFLIWIHNLHNLVRKRSKTPPRSMASVLSFYENQYGNSSFYSYCTIAAAIMAFIVIFLYRARKTA